MSAPDDLDELLESVSDEQSFIAFIQALGTDFARERSVSEPLSPYGRGALGWENGSVDAFLEAAGAWAIASSRQAADVSSANVWQRCASILLAGKFYE
ncbi:hypothetical protein NN484_08705 [Pseudomonas serboccidentalis]|uniref:DUF7660 domain-containing protein n=1 Tax=Pseudomonas serboccidentalis TaxID=2964670 RepID=A0ABY7ZGB4_9PSED|nr:hypothetical protein [Pseudomonas serboccidentalis]WDR37803.1 hypothetical protein NN484_08705 [Pseudomonas serboccidentalis]